MSNKSNNIGNKSPQRLYKYHYNAKKLRRISLLLERAKSYVEDQQFQQANLSYQQVLTEQPGNIIALVGLADLARRCKMPQLAIDFHKHVYDIEPDHLLNNYKLALSYTLLGRYDEAIFHYLCILHQDADNSDVHGKLAYLNLRIGNHDLALKHYKYAFNIDPQQPEYLNGIIRIDPAAVEQFHIDTVEALLERKDIPLENRSSLYFSLGHIYDATKNYDKAFANFTVANISKAVDYDAEKHKKTVDTIIKVFDEDFIQRYQTRALELVLPGESSQQIFVIGMPCAGTHLIERLLCENDEVCGVGDVKLIGEIANIILRKEQLTDDTDILSVHDSIDALLENYSRYYSNSVNQISEEKGYKNPKYVVDSSACNFFHLAIISLLYPQSTIIHCKRDVLETCLSCYFEDFEDGYQFSFDMKTISAFYEQYVRLMSHWEKVLPARILNVSYEDAVKDPESFMHSLSDVIGVPQSKKLLDSEVNDSAGFIEKVRMRDLDKLNRWQHYEKLAAVLGHEIDNMSLVNDFEVTKEVSTATRFDQNK